MAAAAASTSPATSAEPTASAKPAASAEPTVPAKPAVSAEPVTPAGSGSHTDGEYEACKVGRDARQSAPTHPDPAVDPGLVGVRVPSFASGMPIPVE